MHMRIAKALINDGTREREEMKVAAEQEWVKEVGSESTMTQEQVGVALDLELSQLGMRD
jgi:hypothetical protein